MCYEFSNFLYFSIFSILFFVVYLQKSRSSFSSIFSSQSHWMILMLVEPPCPCNPLLPLPLIPPLQGVGPYCLCPTACKQFLHCCHCSITWNWCYCHYSTPPFPCILPLPFPYFPSLQGVVPYCTCLTECSQFQHQYPHPFTWNWYFCL